MQKILILGHENPDVDSIFSGILLETILRKKDFSASFVIPDRMIDFDTQKTLEKYGISWTDYQKNLSFSASYDYILVDHHDRILPKKPLAIYDHHPDKVVPEADYYQNLIASSTTCIIGQEYEEFLTREDMILILVAALVDTASFYSTKTVEEDVLWLKKKCQEFGISMEDYFVDGYALTDMSSKDVCFHGLKKYQEKGHFFESSYLQLLNVPSYQEKIQEMVSVLQEYVLEEDLYVFLLLVHDMESFTSTLYKIYKDSTEVVSYSDYTSRGNVVIPMIREEISTKQKG